MLLEMVLWVLCMKFVGLSITSPSSSICMRSDSLFSQQPKAVPVMMASGHSTPASFKAFSDESREAFISFPIRRASKGFT